MLFTLLFVWADVPAQVLAALRTTTALEWVAVGTGFACVWLAARESRWNFPVAIVSCGLYLVIYHQALLFSDRNLQGFFIVLNGYGWYVWQHGSGWQSTLAVTRTPAREWLWGSLFAAAYTAGFGCYLQQHPAATFPYLDSLTTGVSLVAQFLLMRKRLENWLLWVAVDAVYVPILWVKGLYPTSLLYALYLGLAAYGYWQWRRSEVAAR